MRLQDQVCSQKVAQTLKMLGVHQNSLFHWSNVGVGWKILQPSKYTIEEHPKCYVSAFTASEIETMLPATITRDSITYFLTVIKESEFYQCGYKRIDEKFGTYIVHGPSDVDTLVECYAKMLVQLIEEKLLTIEYCNNKIKG